MDNQTVIHIYTKEYYSAVKKESTADILQDTLKNSTLDEIRVYSA